MTETQKTQQATGINGRDIIQQWLYSLKVPIAIKKKAFSDAMLFLSTKGITNVDSLTKEQFDVLRNALGNYGIRAVEWKKYYPQLNTAQSVTEVQPEASDKQKTQQATVNSKQSSSQPEASDKQNLTFNDLLKDLGLTGKESANPEARDKQNLTFNDLLKDLGLTGKESANPEALKKVQAWLAARPGYKPGAKTNAYLKQLESMPATTKKETPAVAPKKNQTPRPSAVGKGYAFKNKGLYRDAMRAYKAGGATFVGNDGNAEFFNNYDTSKFTVSDINQKTVLNPNIITALKQRF